MVIRCIGGVRMTEVKSELDVWVRNESEVAQTGPPYRVVDIVGICHCQCPTAQLTTNIFVSQIVFP